MQSSTTSAEEGATASTTTGVPTRRPDLHEQLSCVRAPVTWISPVSGQLRGGIAGLYVSDRRALELLVLTVDGREPKPISAALASASEARFVSEVAIPGTLGTDPELLCTRWRRATRDGGVERITFDGAFRDPVTVAVQLILGSDLASIHVVARGDTTMSLPPTRSGSGLVWRDGLGAEVHVTATPEGAVDERTGTISWQARVGSHRSFEIEVRVGATYADGAMDPYRPQAPIGVAPWAQLPVEVQAGDFRLAALVRRSESDLDALRLADSLNPRDEFFAAGSPWYLTLFGRDSLWAARLALVLGPELLMGALRALARRQGARIDTDVDEEPGKMLHELRSPEAGIWRAPLYYGSIDSTLLFIIGVADAHRWGASRGQIEELLPAVEAALAWIIESGDADGDGYLEYFPNDLGLANQSWKDSPDGVQWSDGRLAKGPLAMSEVQGYAYSAAVDGAYLLREFDKPGADVWVRWAEGMRSRFSRSYLISDEIGRYPAIALDGDKRAINGPASNMGHLLGIGLLDTQTERAIADRLLSDAMATGYGIRTLAANAAGFNPLGYHTGSVWPHDNAIALLGLQRAGLRDHAKKLLMQLLSAASHFEFRLPELFSGHVASSALPPVPYSSACSPQAWSAAAGVAIIRALLGIEPDAPRARVTLSPMRPSPVGAYSVANIRVCGGMLSVSSTRDGDVTIHDCPAGVTISVQ